MNEFSLAVAKIEMWFQGSQEKVLGAIGTGFFYKHGSKSHLITNWHNITGIDAETGKVLHSKGLIPNWIRVYYKRWSNDAKDTIKSDHFDLPLYHLDKALWFEHQTRNAVDVVAIPFDEPSPYWANKYINQADQEERLSVYAGMDCFVLGFPKDLFGAAFTPIWKRGSIAAEPYGSHPYYIDSATRKGMSGAPVIVRHSGILKFGGGPLVGSDIVGTVERFVAVYSGRIGDDELGAQLGRAWQADVLDDILTLNTAGAHPMAV